MQLWIARYYDDLSSMVAVRTAYLHASTQDEAAKIAAKNFLGGEVTVDVHPVVLRDSVSLSPGHLLK